MAAGKYENPRTLVMGDSFSGGEVITMTVLESVVIEDGEGNVFGKYGEGISYQGLIPSGTFTVASGSIKLW